MAMFQLRTMPDELKRALRRRARQKGLTMSDYVLGLIRADLDRPTPEDLERRLADLSELPGPPSSQLLAEARREGRRN